ncbi:hypothetical protein C8T65DRAFT_740762 [Cerioporus squamosus]|nr:hypothetical protein C8T65DRAFT_740762 [Cerioporus squamosus]
MACFRHASLPVDVLTWGPGGHKQSARQGALLSILGLDEGSAYFCFHGDAHDDVMLVDIHRLNTSLPYGQPAPNMATFWSNDAGLWLIFRDPAAVDILRLAAETATCSVSQAAPTLSDLQTLGILVEEDITSFYQHSFLGSGAVRVWNSLFESKVMDAPAKDAVSPEDSQTLVNLSCSSAPSDLGSDWKSDEEWCGSCCSESDFEDTEDDVFYDAVETPQCTWFELDV